MRSVLIGFCLPWFLFVMIGILGWHGFLALLGIVTVFSVLAARDGARKAEAEIAAMRADADRLTRLRQARDRRHEPEERPNGARVAGASAGRWRRVIRYRLVPPAGRLPPPEAR